MGVPSTFSNRILLYYSRSSQWLYDATSETDWYAARDTLADWISEHRGKTDNDATWDVISIFDSETMNDLTNELYSFMGPSGDFVHTDHLRRRYSDKIKLESMDGTHTEI